MSCPARHAGLGKKKKKNTKGTQYFKLDGCSYIINRWTRSPAAARWCVAKRRVGDAEHERSEPLSLGASVLGRWPAFEALLLVAAPRRRVVKKTLALAAPVLPGKS